MQRIDKQAGFRAQEDRLKALLRRGLAGDEAGYREFLTVLSTHLRAFLRKRLVHLPDEVEDLLQEALLAVHNQRHTYDPEQPLSAWVQAIARYKLADLWRRRAGHERLTDPLDEDLDLFSTADADAAEARRDLGKLLAELPEHFRRPIEHTKLAGLSVKEAAQRCGMSESAIKIGVHRGLKALAARIRGES